MSRRRANLNHRCPKCYININECFCEEIPKLETKAKVSIIMHIKEKALSSNTGRIAALALKNSHIYIRGNVENKSFSDVYKPDPSYHQLYLYPTHNSKALDEDFLQNMTKPIELVVPDASWNQAKKFHHRVPEFKTMDSVHLAQDYKTIYDLRTQKYEYGVCTLEAIAYALKEIEGEHICQALLETLKVMNHRTLKQRQKI